MRVKICGITSVEDTRAAVRAGADALGLNFVGGPRKIGPDIAGQILANMAPFITPVALVSLDNGRVPETLLKLLSKFKVSHLQLYGGVTSESLAHLSAEGFHSLCVLPVKDADFADNAATWIDRKTARYSAGIVLDTYDPKQQGGTGKVFQWDLVSKAAQAGKLADWPPIILAGGLNPDNVAKAVRAVQPFGVDVSSGVEIAGSPGKKDEDKMRAFVCNARSAANP